ncbi:MAG: hypothetical protein WBG64_09845, partial [Thermoanaerobaculia bacterium]
MTIKCQVISVFLSGLALMLLVVPGAVVAGEKTKTLTVEIDGPEDQALSFSISGDFVNHLVGGLAGKELNCDTDLDSDTMAMLRHLSRRGEGSRYTLETEDQVIKARRRKGQLELTIREDGEKKAEITMPWSIAACLAGDETALRAAKGNGELHLD